MVLSVIIPAYNEEKYLPQTISKLSEAINDAAAKLAWEVIVCDNNSTDNTSSTANQLGARVIFEEENQISKARNIGATIAKGEWLLFIDADTYPSKALMLEIMETIENNKLVGCGVTVSVKDGSLFNKLRMERLNPFFRFFKVSGGAFLLVEKNSFKAIQGFSEGLYAYEEFDFIFRLKKYGKSIGKDFDVLHKHPVITSGRKGEINLKSLSILFFSNFTAIVLMVMYYLLPTQFVTKLGKKTLKFWYNNR